MGDYKEKDRGGGRRGNYRQRGGGISVLSHPN